MKKLITFLIDEDDEEKALAAIDAVDANTPLWYASILTNEELHMLAEQLDYAQDCGIAIGMAFHRALKAKEDG